MPAFFANGVERGMTRQSSGFATGVRLDYLDPLDFLFRGYQCKWNLVRDEERGGVARSLRQPAASSGFDPVAPESSKKELRSPAVWRGWGGLRARIL